MERTRWWFSSHKKLYCKFIKKKNVRYKKKFSTGCLFQFNEYNNLHKVLN